MINEPFSILHQPYGEQHPYIPLNCERSPRDPASGEVVTLQAETETKASVERVTCRWQVSGKDEAAIVDATKVNTSNGKDVWQVNLPAFQGGEQVTYSFHAENGNQKVKSDLFAFEVNRWIVVAKLVFAEGKGDTFSAVFSSEDDETFIRCLMKCAGNENIHFTLEQIEKQVTHINNVPDKICCQNGKLELSIHSKPARWEIQRITDGLKLQMSSKLSVLLDATGKVLKYRVAFDSPDDEAFYGFGERFNALDQRGTRLDNRVYGQYTSQGKRTYTPIPFFVSSRGYGLWLKTDRQAAFDLAAELADQWYLVGEADGAKHQLEMDLFLQATPKEIVQNFVKETGMPKLPPDWVFGLWMSSNDWNSQAEVLRQLKLAKEYDIPATVLVIEAWSDEINFYIWNDAKYELKPSSEVMTLKDFTFPEDGRWTDPKAMIDTLHEAGIRLVLWQNPAIKQAREDEHLDVVLNQQDQVYLIEKGFVVRNADEEPHRVEGHMPWFGDSLVLDFTNPGAEDWWFSKRAYLVQEMGVDGFKTDGGEHIWDLQTTFHNGMKGHRGINRYPVDYEEAYRKFMEKYRGDDFVLFSRAGYTGAQVNPCHWAGDENSTFEAFRATINAMLNIGISGVPFFGWDIAGFAGPLPTSELYLRATAFSVFCPIMQYHSDVNHQRTPSRDRTPWNMQEQTGDEDVIPTFRWFTKVRMNLLPYILGEARKSSRSGNPMTRALALEFSADKTCREFPSQYLFGEALLVAPVVEEGVNTWPVYLPEGQWLDFWTGERYQGPGKLNVDVPRNRIPVFQRQGTIVALNVDETGLLGAAVGNAVDKVNHLLLRVFPEGDYSSEIFIPGESEMKEVHVNCSQDGLEIQLPPLNQVGWLEIYTDQPQTITMDGKPVSDWTWDKEYNIVKIPFKPTEMNSKIIIQ
jgi:alpha-glucosidase (family GH31 glycosyl hydrolase)